MKVLLLSPYPEKISSIIEKAGDEVTILRTQWVSAKDYDFIVSYGWPFIIPPKTVRHFGPRIINIHIGYLPWNRGADPNFWSWHDDTPKGVTIHQMDEGIDTGPILSQVRLPLDPRMTLKMSYGVLRAAAESLFIGAWSSIRNQTVPPYPQAGLGTSHKKKDREAIWHHFPLGWDTPVKDVEEFGRRSRDEHGKRAGSSGA